MTDGNGAYHLISYETEQPSPPAPLSLTWDPWGKSSPQSQPEDNFDISVGLRVIKTLSLKEKDRSHCIEYAKEIGEKCKQKQSKPNERY